MTKFAFTDHSEWIRQFDTANPSAVPFGVRLCPTNVTHLACTADQEFQTVWGPGGFEIHRTTGPKTDTPIYVHSLWIYGVRVRVVGGKERIYFSAPKSKEQSGPQLIDIFYLKETPLGLQPVHYHTVDPTQLTFPNPCNPDATPHYSYVGDFAFGDDDTLYLSSGNFGGCKVGIYKVTGAGPDQVTGTLSRIHLREGPIQGLCFKAAQGLFFLHENQIWHFDLVQETEKLLGTIPSDNLDFWVSDIAEVGDGVPMPPYWPFAEPVLNGLHWLFFSMAKMVRCAGDQLRVAGRSKANLSASGASGPSDQTGRGETHP